MPAGADPSTPADLPIVLTRFVGRERELGELERLATATRLLTLTGAGGSGKTRLARELTARQGHLFELTAWADLAQATDPGAAAALVGAALRAVERRDRSPIETVAAAIGPQRALLVLDNCEHLVAAVAELAEGLLRGCSGLTVLATSREALGVPGETAWLVPPLGTPEAIQLFVERARQVVPGFGSSPENADAIAAICRRLDGIPLAIELAAARVRVLSPDQIAGRLSDALRVLSAGSRTALPRHRTIRATLDWSFGLLTPFEQRLLERLAVFAGTFSITAAEAVCSGDRVERDLVLDGVAALFDKSLVLLESTDSEARYRLLETVRQYLEERLAGSVTLESLRARHAAHFLAEAERAAPHMFAGAGSAVWFARLSHDAANLRAAGDWAAERPERAETALRLGWALHWFWYARGAFEEGRQRLTAALEAGGVGVDPVTRAKGSIALGHIGIWQGWRTGVRPLMEAAAEVLRTAGDPRLLAYAVNGVGAALVFEGDPVGARPHLDLALSLMADHDPDPVQALINSWRGWAARERGDLATARLSLVEASRIGRVLGHPPAIAHPLTLLGQFDVAAGRPAEALGHFSESLPILARIGDAWGIGRTLEGVGTAALMLGSAEDAVGLVAAAEGLRQRNATYLSAGELEGHHATVARLRTALGARFDEAWQAGFTAPLEVAVERALGVARRTGVTRAEASAPPMAPAPVPPAPLRVRALGPLEISRHGVPIEAAAWGSARTRELLVYLLCHPRGVSREQVGAALWPEASAAQVRNGFHVALHRLRKTLGEGEWVVAVQDRCRIDPDAIEFDVTRFEQELEAAGDPALEGEGAARRLAAGLSRYAGPFLAGESVGAWSRVVAERLEHRFITRLLDLIAWQLSLGRYADAIEGCHRIIAQQPLHEEAWRRLMTAQAGAGQAEQALRSYQQLTSLLQAETGSAPDPATAEVLHRITSR